MTARAFYDSITQSLRENLQANALIPPKREATENIIRGLAQVVAAAFPEVEEFTFLRDCGIELVEEHPNKHQQLPFKRKQS